MSSFGSDGGGADEVRVRLEWPHARPTSRPLFPGLESVPDEEAAREGMPVGDPEPAGSSAPQGDRTDIEELRSEVAALRQVTREVGDQLRHVGTVLDELADLRAQIRELIDLRPVSPALGSLAPLVAEIAALREDVSLEPVLAQLDEMRAELMQVRRRVRLRASGGNAYEFPS